MRPLQILAGNVALAGYPDHARFLPELVLRHGLPLIRDVDGISLRFDSTPDGRFVCVVHETEAPIASDLAYQGKKHTHALVVQLDVRHREMLREEGGGSFTAATRAAVAMYLRSKGRRV